MRRTMIFGLAFLCAYGPVCGYASVTGITVLSGEQHIWGLAYERDEDYAIIDRGSYDSGLVPWTGSGLSDSVQVRPYFWAESEIDALSVRVAAQAVFTIGGYPPAHAFAYAEGTWVFQPEGDTLLIEKDTLNNFSLDQVVFELDDLSTGQALLHYSGLAERWWLLPPMEPNRLELPVDVSHEYRLHMYLETSANDDGWGGCINATAVPAPGALVLGLIGTGLVHCLRRRQRT